MMQKISQQSFQGDLLEPLQTQISAVLLPDQALLADSSHPIAENLSLNCLGD